jgi:hypothetical protein
MQKETGNGLYNENRKQRAKARGTLSCLRQGAWNKAC